MEELLIQVNPDGSIQITVKGIKGRACKDVTRQIERALGHVVSDKPTSEMHETEVKRVLNRG